MSTRTQPRAAQRGAEQRARARKPHPTTPPQKRTVTKVAAADAICDELDRLDLDDELRYLAHDHAPAMKVLAGLSDERRQATHEMVDAQRVYLQVLEDLGTMVADQNGRIHDLRAIQSTVMAFAWTLSLLGYRKTAKQWIKKRRWKDRHGVERETWVDIRQPDTPDEQHRADDRNLPPDLRSLAAQRDDLSPRVQGEWHTTVEPKIVDAPRPKDW
jgi:hypothetical protein